MSDQTTPRADGTTFPVLPLRDIVVFPYMIVPLFVGREKSINALEEVMRTDKHILLAAQKNAGDDDPDPDGIYEVGYAGLRTATSEAARRHRQSSRRRHIARPYSVRSPRTTPITKAKIERSKNRWRGREVEALARSAVSQFEQLREAQQEDFAGSARHDPRSKTIPSWPTRSHRTWSSRFRQAGRSLEITTISERLERVYALMESEISVLQVEKKIRSRVKRQMEKTQREYYLNEQMKAIQKELGDGDDRDDIVEFEEKIENTKLTKEARDKAMAELKKLKQMSPMSAEATVVRNYLDWMLSIPWGVKGKVKKDLSEAETCSITSTTVLRRSRSASSSIWPCRTAPTS
jgi:ATP-dependent Lon protease